MGQFARATALLALVVVTGLLFAGTAGATGSHVSHVSTATDACSTPSLQDVADSDFFWYWPCASFLHVETTPAGESLGYVRSTPYAIDCPHACTRPFAAGTSVVLTAYPSNGAYFTDWSGACAGQGNPCTVTVNGDTQVTANFGGVAIPAAPANAPDVTLSIFWGFWSNLSDAANVVTNPGPHGCAFGTCTYSFPKGTTVTVGVGDANSCTLSFHKNGTGSFGTGTGAPLWQTSYTFTLNSSTVIAPFIAGSGDPGTCP